MEEDLETRQQPYILYADDDPDDQAFVAETLRKVNHNIRMQCFENGLQLVQYLEDLPQRSVLPCCMILDLNMPIWDGKHTLHVLKNHHAYDQIPVFIFSTSASAKDIHLASAQGAVAYVTKPYAQNELLEICQEFAEYALMEPRYKISELPAKHRGA
jgi:CheY-like chemotaxis protein